jgi:hypothetical protein
MFSVGFPFRNIAWIVFMRVCGLQEDIHDSMKNLDSQSDFEEYTYYSSKEVRFRNQRFPTEIMHGHSIYENQIGIFCVA